MSTSARRDRIFISYRRSDSAGHAGRLEDDLTRLLGDRVFMDVSDIAPGADFERVLRSELASCGAVLAVIGARWLEAFDAPREGLDYVRLELALALAQEGVHVVPVLMQGVSLPATGKLPSELQALGSRQAAAIRDERWKDDVAHLARELRGALKLRRVSPWWIAAIGVVLPALAALALWFALNTPPAPAAFSRNQVHDITMAATAKAAAACQPAGGLSGECPLVFQFAPDGSTRNVYFNSGSCSLKAPPFGECLLKRLADLRIPPFDNVGEAEVGLDLRLDASASIEVVVEH